MSSNPKAFVIMPFDPEFNSIYEELIKPSLDEAGYDVTRADSFLDQQNILSDIVRGITTAQLVVADLTTNNPNVFYELGLCHGLRIPTVLLAQSINEVPFDLRSYKIQVYETHFNKIHKLKDALKAIGEKHIKGEVIFGSPVVDFAFSKPEPVSIVTNEVLEDEVEDAASDLDEKGVLDYLLEGEQAGHELTNILTRLTKDNEAITNKITKHAASINILNNNPGAGTATKYHKLSLLAASDMNMFSKKVEDVLPLFENAVNKLDESYSGYIDIVEPSLEVIEQVSKFKNTIEDLLQSSRGTGESFRSYRDTVSGLSQQKISKEINRASRRQAQALEGIVSNIERVEAFCLKTLAVIDVKFGSEMDKPEGTA